MEFVRLAVDPARQRPRQAVDDLVDMAVIMRDGDARVGVHGHLEDHELARSLRLIHQKTQLHPTYPNDVVNSAFHGGLTIVKCFYVSFVKCLYINVNVARS
jgi:hypothetical protein